MDKSNKKRPDLLAAGRKKLEQYRQKKDGKGGKSSGKTNKSEHTSKSAHTSRSDQEDVLAAEMLEKDNRIGAVAAASSELDTSKEGVVPIGNDGANDHKSSKDGIIESTSSEPVPSQDKLPVRESNELQDNSETIASGENSAIPDMREQVDIRSQGERPKEEEQQVTDIGAMQKGGGNSAEQDDTISSEISIESVSNAGGNFVTKDPITYAGEVREDAHISPAAAVVGAESLDNHEHSVFGQPSSASEGTINVIPKVEDDEANGAGVFSEEIDQGDQGDGREDAAGSNLEYTVDDSVQPPSQECTVLTLSSASGVFPVSLSQLAEVIQRLDDNAFRVLLDYRHTSAEKVSTTPSTGTTDIAVVEAFEKLKEHLYLESCAKDALQLQLAEQLEEKMLLQQQLQKLGSDLSIAGASLVQSQGNNETVSKDLALCRSELVKVASEKEELQNQLHGSKCQLDEHISKINKLQNELDTLQENLVKVSSELDGRRNAESYLLTETERLSSRLGFLNEEKNEVTNENMKIMSELDHCKTSLTSLQLEKESLAKNLALLIKEKRQFDEENKFLIQENNMLHSDLTDCKGMVVALQVERTYLNEILAAAVKEDKEYSEDYEDTPGIGESETTVKILEKSSFGGSVAIKPKPQQLQLSDVEGLSEFNSWRRSMDDAGEVFRKLEKAIEILHSHSHSLNKTVTPVAPAVSKLIQAFELKTHTEEQETSDLLSSATLNTSNVYMLTKEQMKNLKVILDEMFSQMENSCKFLAAEKKSRLLAEETVAEVQASYEYLRSHSDLLEEEMIEHLVLCESLRQRIYDSAATVSDLVVLCEASQKQQYELSSENSQLRGKVSGICGKIGEFQDHLDEICQSADEMVSSVSCQVEILLKEVTDTGSLLADEWNSFVAQVIEALGELEASIEPLRSYDFSTGLDTINGVGKRLVASINGAKGVVETLQGELKAVQKNHDVALSNYSELYKHFNSLKDENEKATSMLLKIYRNLRQFVIVFCESAEGINTDLKHEKLLDPLDSSVFDVLMENLGGFADEKKLLESVNNKLKSELVDHSRQINELKRRSLDSDTILRLFEDAERAFKLDSFDVQTYEPESCLASLINILIQKYKEAEHQMSSLTELHAASVTAELNDLTLWLIEFDIQNTVLKDGWKIVSDNIPALRVQLFEKISELEQSEQRVSSLRDKLGMAVTKGKGLVAQRDSLKQSLAESSNQLEQCSQELHSKDVRIHELEIKLKNYSEAGERMEALESELSYIRNSATALRESFLLKDSALQRIEEILEDLELPEHFHSGGLIEKVDWLAKSVTRNTNPPTEWDQRSAFGGESVSDGGFGVMDGWKEETSLSQNSVDDLRRRYDELQSKFYGLAEQNEMLEQSLMESNNLVQRWETGFDKLNIPSQLRFSEPEDRMQWLDTALSEAQDSCISLQQRVDYLNTLCESLNGDFDASRKKIEEQELANESLTSEKEGLLKNLETLNSQYDETLQKVTELEKNNESLLKEVGLLQARLGKEHEHAERIREIEGELIRLQSEIKVALQYSDASDSDFGSDSMECLERLLIKLIEEYKALALIKPVNVDASDMQANKEEGHSHLEGSNANSSIDGAMDVAELHKNLEEALSEVMHLKEERERYKENNQALICQVEALDLKKKELLELSNEEEQKSASLREKLNTALSEVTHLLEERERYKENSQVLIREVEELDLKKKELLELLNQEEQKSASLREKLNMAVKKGKSLVQQRDNLKQNIEELNSEIAHLKSQLSIRDTTLADYELRISNMSINLQRIEAVESECLILKDRLAESELILHEREHTLSMMLNVLKDIDVHTDYNSENPVEKLQEIGKRCHELQSALDSCNKDLKKSREAADLLFAELNEVQERNDNLQEELAHVIRNHSEISREILSAEAAKSAALSELQKISATQSKEREDHFAEVTALKSYVNQVKEDIAVIDELVSDVLTNNMEILSNLAATAKSCVGSALSPDIDVAQFSTSGGMISNKFRNKMFVIELGFLKEKLCSHDKSSYAEANRIAEVVHSIHKEVASIRHASGARESHLMQLEAMLKEKDSELFALRRNISLLYEACTISFMEIEKWKAQRADEAPSDLKIHTSIDKETDLTSEENVRVVTDKLILVVKNLISMKNDSALDSHKEMKTLIVNLQKELHEKDIQRDRISMELVTQIKESESVAKKYLQDLQSAKAQVEHLRSQLILMEEERKTLENKVEELINMEASLQELQQRYPLLTDALASKEEENEALMRALDEEETQMEEMTIKIGELEKALKQKDHDLENLQASRDKAVKKLSVTVRKFDELHGFSESLLSEVEKLQSQLQEREEEISFLRQEVTRCTNESLTASQIVNKKNSDEVNELLTRLEMMISQVPVHDLPSDDAKNNQVDDRKQLLEKQMTRIISELEELRSVAQNKDVRVEELSRKTESLENLLRDKESQLIMQKGLSDSGQSPNAGSEIMEVDSLINKRVASGTIATQVRGARKTNSDQVAIAIDMDPSRLEEEDDDKAHGFKSLTTSRIVPRFTRPVSDMIDGVWVSCDRALQRQPALRLGLIMYWAMIHALLAAFVV